MTIDEIKTLLSSGDVSTDLLIKLENDSRKG
ncbi:MAG: ribonuclease HII, partial [Lactobacillus iners]|nr:ribonuclease HII [Lactobacillus iners]